MNLSKAKYTLRLSNWCLHAYQIHYDSDSESDDSEPHGLLRCHSVGRYLIRLLLFSSAEQHRYMVDTDAVWTELPSLTFALNVRGFSRS